MTDGGRRTSDDTSRLKQDFKYEVESSDDFDEEPTAQKRRRPWKEDHRRQDRESKKQRQRNTEWND